MAKKHSRKLGVNAYFAALNGGDIELLEEMTRKEAARQVGELLKWKEYHEKYDPLGIAEDDYVDELFPLVEKSARYRYKLYNLNKQHAKADFEFVTAKAKGDPEEIAEAQEALAEIEDKRIALCWRIRKIYMYVGHKALLDVTPEDDIESFFKEYEYGT